MALKQTHSFKSVRSAPHTPSVKSELDITQVLKKATKRFNCPVSIHVHKDYMKQDIKKDSKTSKTKKLTASFINDEADTTSLVDKYYLTSESVLQINALHDLNNRLTAVSMIDYKYMKIPRCLLQLLSYILPNYPNLSKFTISDCSIDKYTIYELTNILEATKITEICLDSTFLPEGNYYLLLQNTSTLRHLSLSRCKINDPVCKEIMSQLHFSKPAEALSTLNISSNFITDAGAKSIGDMLRTNRHLRHLNIAGNQISDDGAGYIFDVLKLFRLTDNEIYKKRQLHQTYQRNRNAIRIKCLLENDFINRDEVSEVVSKNKKEIKESGKSSVNAFKSKSGFKKVKKRQNALTDDQAFDAKLEFMILSLLGPFEHPYCNAQLTTTDGYTYCNGNLILCYLNIAYNNLTFSSLKNLLKVLQYQNTLRNEDFCGLMKVVLNGNNLPEKCTELDKINEIFSKGFTNASVRSCKSLSDKQRKQSKK